ncbi:hypothetical protein ICL16_36080 [Iningainema sp. BLCCT55]|uniref:Uncharacterized protein n=1 Tax=Iningainema tapete BLCC-T55 TaxID=2748662 RepID=A0A8J6XQD2_9CYAN|nr:hypothetical protein [Iningainema tapete BLCC-T55]
MSKQSFSFHSFQFKFIALILFLTLSFLVLPALASTCRNYQGHQICIISIDRSAKNYWEYRAAVSVDGVKSPVKVYKCRTQVKIEQDGTVVPFGQNDAGKLICSFFKKSA